MTSMLIGWLSSTPILATREGDLGDELRKSKFPPLYRRSWRHPCGGVSRSRAGKRLIKAPTKMGDKMASYRTRGAVPSNAEDFSGIGGICLPPLSQSRKLARCKI